MMRGRYPMRRGVTFYRTRGAFDLPIRWMSGIGRMTGVGTFETSRDVRSNRRDWTRCGH
jgi:hypothetical protein